MIDNESFDLAIEHFAFPLYHRIADMDELAKLHLLTRLTSASFSGTGLDDRGLAHVASVETIDNLNLQETVITNGGLAVLSRLPRLRYLRLKDNRQLTDDCVPHLVRLQALVDLQIHQTSIEHLEPLVVLPSLRDLLVPHTISFDALRALSARMPACTILAKGRGKFRCGAFDGTWD